MSTILARQFADWWAQHRCDDPWFRQGVAASFAWWWEPKGRALTEEEEEAILDELEVRGMIVTDLDMEQDEPTEEP